MASEGVIRGCIFVAPRSRLQKKKEKSDVRDYRALPYNNVDIAL